MPGFSVIVAGTDGSSLAEEAVAHAAHIAKQDGSTLHIVCGFPDPGHFRERLRSSATDKPGDLRAVAEDALARATAHVKDQGVEPKTHLIENDPAEAIVAVAGEVGADLVVVGSRGLSRIERFTMGSVSDKVFHHAPCTVLVVKHRD